MLSSYPAELAHTILLNGITNVQGAPQRGAAVAVATLDFVALKGGDHISEMGGVVVTLGDLQGEPIGGAAPRPFVAGAGDLAPDERFVFGDADDDGAFDAIDVLFIQRHLAGLVQATPLQVAQCNEFPDADCDIGDALYLSLVLARLSHFVWPQAAGGATPAERRAA